MTRPLRIRFKRAIYHVYSRGNRKEHIFLDDNAIIFFLDKLAQGVEKYGIEIHAYCVMGTHYHLLITTPEPNISEFMHYLQSSYASYMVKRGWVGHVFAGRFEAQLVGEWEYLLVLTRYIHRNPVKAGLVARPEEYFWSSYRAYVEPKSDDNTWLDTALLLAQFDQDPMIARKRLEEFVLKNPQEDCSFPRESVVARAILGSEEYVDEIRGLLAGEEIPTDTTGKRKLQKARGLLEVYEMVLDSFRLEVLRTDPWDIEQDKALLREARMAFIYLAREYTIATNQEIASMLGDVGGTVISHHFNNMKRLGRHERSKGSRLLELDEILKGKGGSHEIEDSRPDPD